MSVDTENLREYCATGGEEAFRRLVESHAGMVRGVAGRMVRNPALAEEITQSVFVVLARKAKSVSGPDLAGWLHAVAIGESRNAVRKEIRRRALNQKYTEAMKDPEPSLEQWQEIAPHLDEAVAELPGPDRELIVLRYFERRNFRQIASVVGSTETACRKRAERALRRLGELLTQRGVTAGVPVLAGALGAFALFPPSASAAALASVAVSSATASAGMQGSLKFLKIMTTQAAPPTVKLLHILPPLIVLSLGAAWTFHQHRVATKLEDQTGAVRLSLASGDDSAATRTRPPERKKR